METGDKTRKPFLLLFLLIFHIVLFVTFQSVNKTFQTWDSAGHIGMSFHLADQIRNLTSAQGEVTLTDVIKSSNYYPPLVQLIGAFLSLYVAYSSDLLVYVSLVFFLISIIFLYKVVLYVSQNPKKAFFATFIYSLFPHILEQSRVFHLDIPLIALLLIAFYFLLLSRSFTKTKYTLLFFVFFAFAQLTKWYAWIYLVIPVLYSLHSFFRSTEAQLRRRGMFVLILGSVAFSLIVLPWYVLNFSDLLSLVRIFGKGEIDDPTNVFSLKSILYYPERILSFQIFLLPAIVSLLGAIRLFKVKRSLALYVAFLVVFPIIVFILISNKNLRYVLPLTPIFAYLISDFVFSLNNRILYGGLVGLYVLFAGLFVSFNQLEPRNDLLKPIGMVLAGPKYNDWYHNPQVYSYEDEAWPVGEVLDFIVEDAQFSPDKGLGITVLADSKNFSLATFEMLRREKKFNNVYVPVPYFRTEPFDSIIEIEGYFEENDVSYVVVPQDPGPEGLRNYAVLSQLVKYFASPDNQIFTAGKSFDLPDGTRLVVYKKVGLAVTEVAVGGCIETAGFGDGVESLRLIPETTYIFFTGHFGLNDNSFEYEEGVLYILQLENTVHESVLNVHALPENGSTLCVRQGLNHSVAVEIRRPLVEPNHCGADCNEVVHVMWNIGDEEISVDKYVRTDPPPIK